MFNIVRTICTRNLTASTCRGGLVQLKPASKRFLNLKQPKIFVSQYRIFMSFFFSKILIYCLTLFKFNRIFSVREVLGNSTAIDVNNQMKSSDSLLCPPIQSQSGLCWPKCCFENQVFNLNKMSCGKPNRDDILLRKPDVFDIR